MFNNLKSIGYHTTFFAYNSGYSALKMGISAIHLGMTAGYSIAACAYTIKYLTKMAYYSAKDIPPVGGALFEYSIGRVVLPSCVLTNKADSLAALATERWLARINMPLAVLNIVLIASKASKQRTIDDYVILGTSATSIYDYFNGPSVAEARNKLTKALSNCDTPEAILKFFVDNEILDKGGMSFLKTWIENQNSIGVRVGRTSSPVLYKNRSLSFGGPYPIHLFPQKRTQNDENTSEVMVPKKRF